MTLTLLPQAAQASDVLLPPTDLRANVDRVAEVTALTWNAPPLYAADVTGYAVYVVEDGERHLAATVDAATLSASVPWSSNTAAYSVTSLSATGQSAPATTTTWPWCAVFNPNNPPPYLAPGCLLPLPISVVTNIVIHG